MILWERTLHGPRNVDCSGGGDIHIAGSNGDGPIWALKLEVAGVQGSVERERSEKSEGVRARDWM